MIPLFLLASLALAAPIPDEPKYTGEAEAIRVRFNQLFEASKKVNDPKTKVAARAQIEAALDWGRIGADCLGKRNSAKASGGQRADFTSTLKEVVIRTSFSRLDKFWDGATPRFDVIDVSGNEAHIVCRFYFATENLTLDYYVNKKGGRWLIYDLAYDEIRYSINIHDQITAFLKEKTMAELLVKLKKRRDELGKS